MKSKLDFNEALAEVRNAIRVQFPDLFVSTDKIVPAAVEAAGKLVLAHAIEEAGIEVGKIRWIQEK